MEHGIMMSCVRIGIAASMMGVCTRTIRVHGMRGSHGKHVPGSSVTKDSCARAMDKAVSAAIDAAINAVVAKIVKRSEISRSTGV